MRAGGNAVGQNVPAIFGGLGAATSGIRSGVSLADQAADGAVDLITAPAAVAAATPAADVRVPPLAGCGRCSAPVSDLSAAFQIHAHDLVRCAPSRAIVPAMGRLMPASVKSLGTTIANPTSPQTTLRAPRRIRQRRLTPADIVDALSPANLQGAADSALDTIAAIQ